MKLTVEERRVAFKSDKANESVYDNLKGEAIKLPLQILQQYFHLYKPQKHTHPDAHVAYVFTLANKKNEPIKGNWGKKILNDIIRVAHTKSYHKTCYIGNGVILTHIIYEALGMRAELKPMPRDEDILTNITKQREKTLREQKPMEKMQLWKLEDSNLEEEEKEELAPPAPPP